jgi:hypothetical protein
MGGRSAVSTEGPGYGKLRVAAVGSDNGSYVILSIKELNPSGEPIPIGDLPGWHQTLADDFNGFNTSDWYAYSGEPGDGGYWAPSHVTTSGGNLVIKGYQDPAFSNRWVTGGISGTGDQTYGKWTMRFRMDDGKGLGYAMSLWPRPEIRPWYIGFAENYANNSHFSKAALHYPDVSGHEVIDKKEISVDSSQWHTWDVEWTPTKITCRLDGQIWAGYTNNIPTIPMHIAIQDQAWCCGCAGRPCPDSSTPKEVDLQVDWVVQYSRVNVPIK